MNQLRDEIAQKFYRFAYKHHPSLFSCPGYEHIPKGWKDDFEKAADETIAAVKANPEIAAGLKLLEMIPKGQTCNYTRETTCTFMFEGRMYASCFAVKSHPQLRDIETDGLWRIEKNAGCPRPFIEEGK